MSRGRASGSTSLRRSTGEPALGGLGDAQYAWGCVEGGLRSRTVGASMQEAADEAACWSQGDPWDRAARRRGVRRADTSSYSSLEARCRLETHARHSARGRHAGTPSMSATRRRGERRVGGVDGLVCAAAVIDPWAVGEFAPATSNGRSRSTSAGPSLPSTVASRRFGPREDRSSPSPAGGHRSLPRYDAYAASKPPWSG